MRYIDYLIKCIIRRLVRLIFKPKILISILFILLILTLSLYNKSYCAENDIFTVYNSINQDLINRLDKGNTNRGFYNYLNNINYNFLVYYGNPNGSDMYNSTYDTSKINVAFYRINSQLLDFETTDTKWGGVTQSKAQLSSSSVSSVNVFVFDENGSYFETGVDQLMIPPALFNYRSPAIFEYTREQKNVQDITNSITDGTDKINNSINDTNNFIKDDTISNDSMTVDTTGYEIEGQASIDNFFIEFLNIVYDVFVKMDNSVEQISIPLPYGIPDIVLYSDIISKHIINTPLYTLIQLFWTFVFGKYIVMFVKRLFDWLSTGEIAEKGVFGFIDWLDNYNSIIKSWMM